MQTYTFVCLDERQSSTVIDIAHLEPAHYRAHARLLLARHASADRIEVWNDIDVVDVLERSPNPDPPTSDDVAAAPAS